MVNDTWLPTKYGFSSTFTFFSIQSPTLISGIFCLKCEVGHNNETKVMDCHGSWDQMQMTMKEKLGDTWDDIKQNMTSMTSVIDSLKMSFDKVSGAIQNALKPSEDTRRKRETDEEASAEPEPEPEADDYYCIKQSVAGHTLKSCLPKVTF